MSFSYYDKDNNIKKIDIKVGMQWSDIKTDNDDLNSVFSNVDDGDGLVQLTEKMIVEDFLKKIDNNDSSTAKNQILENEELKNFDINKAKLSQEFDKSYFTIESIKQAYPEDKYTYSSGSDSIVITNNETGEEVLRFHKEKFVSPKRNQEEEFIKINEYSSKGSYSITIAETYSQISHSDNSFQTDLDYTYKDDKISEIDNVSVYEIIATNLFNNINNSNSIDENTLKNIDNIPADKLIDMMQDCYLKHDKYILDEIYKSKNIDEKTKTEFLIRTLNRLDDNAGYKKEYTVENSHVSNKYYESKNTYYVNFSNDIITIRKNPSDNNQASNGNFVPEERTINLNKFLSRVPFDVRPAIKAALQKIPGEVLMDLAIETDCFDVSNVIRKNYKGTATGLYDINNDRMAVGICNIKDIKPETIVHEIGHAIDNRQKGAVPLKNKTQGEINTLKKNDIEYMQNNEPSSYSNKKLEYKYNKAKYKYIGIDKYMKFDEDSQKIEFDEEKLIERGFLSADKKWTDKYRALEGRAYMYSGGYYELFSEGYLVNMMGHSYNTPEDAFDEELMDEFNIALDYNRSLEDDDRHRRRY